MGKKPDNERRRGDLYNRGTFGETNPEEPDPRRGRCVSPLDPRGQYRNSRGDHQEKDWGPGD